MRVPLFLAVWKTGNKEVGGVQGAGKEMMVTGYFCVSESPDAWRVKDK
jgi:hypothetical protein